MDRIILLSYTFSFLNSTDYTGIDLKYQSSHTFLIWLKFILQFSFKVRRDIVSLMLAFRFTSRLFSDGLIYFINIGFSS